MRLILVVALLALAGCAEIRPLMPLWKSTSAHPWVKEIANRPHSDGGG